MAVKMAVKKGVENGWQAVVWGRSGVWHSLYSLLAWRDISS